jgi:hypothetical protein
LLHVAPQLIVPGELVTVPEPVPVVLTVRVKVGAGAKVAVTPTEEVGMVKLHAPVPEQAPLQPANTEAEDAGAAVRVTTLPLLIALEFVQVPDGAPEVIVQLMPPVPVTVPLPVPAPVTVTLVRLKVALTDCAEVIDTEHAPVPLQAPPQPANADPAGALGVRVTLVPLMKLAEQVAPQLMPAGALVMVPVPAPTLETVKVKVGAGEKVAVAETGVMPIVNVQAPVPVQGPLQPEKTEAEDAGDAVNVTVLPLLIALEFVHVPEGVPEVMVQLIPPVPVTVPLPVPEPVTVTVVRLKVALTDCAEVIETEHAPVPVQAPPQPLNADPAGATGFRVTVVPLM